MLSQKARAEFARCMQQPSMHASRWNNAWLQLCFDLFVEPQTNAWYSLQLWPRAKHDMDMQRTPALTVMRHNIDLDADGRRAGRSDAAPVSDVQSVLVIDYLDTSSWNDPTAISNLENRVRSQTAHILEMHAGEYGYGQGAVYFILAVGQSWRFGMRDKEGFKYISNWHSSIEGLEARRDLQRLVDAVERL